MALENSALKENVCTSEGSNNRRLEKLQNEELHNLCTLPNSIGMIK
jgi:hypothetical protein